MGRGQNAKNKNKENNTVKAIIGNAFEKLKTMKYWEKDKEKFLTFFGMDPKTAEYIVGNNHTNTSFFNYGYYKGIINVEKFYHNCQKKVEGISEEDKKLINMTLREVLSEDNKYANDYDKNTLKKDIQLIDYDKKSVDCLLYFYELQEYTYDLAYNMSLFLRFAIDKELPEKFYYGANYAKALKEFNDEVLTMYGVTAMQGVRAILYLADKKNVFALYEKADMYYYGNNAGIKQDIVMAFEMYKQAAGFRVMSGVEEDDAERAQNSFVHPLALWSLAYIYFNYHRANTKLAKCPNIPQIDCEFKGNELGRVECAAKYAKMAFELMDYELAPAANILGKISLLTENDLEGISVIKEKYNLDSAENYFKLAADKGYIYSINNLAMMEAEKLFTSPKDTWKEHLKNVIGYFEKAEEQHEPQGSNMLGDLYRTGIIQRRDGIIGPRLDETREFPEIVSDSKAFIHYQRATVSFLNVYSAWAYCSMITYYPKRIIENDLLFAYMKSIHELGFKAPIDKMKNEWPEEYNFSYEEVKKYIGY